MNNNSCQPLLSVKGNLNVLFIVTLQMQKKIIIIIIKLMLLLPDTKVEGLITWDLYFRFLEETLNMGQSSHSGSHKPWDSKDRTDTN